MPDKLLHSAWRAEKLFFRVKLSVPGTCRAEDVTEYFKIGEASPEGFFKSVLTFQDVVATGRYIQRHLFNEPEARQARCHMGNFPTHGRAPHGPSAGGPGRSPRIPQGKGVLIGRIATRHSGFDTSSVISLGVCARARTKSLHSSSRVVSVHSRVWGGQTPGIHTRRTQWRRRPALPTRSRGRRRWMRLFVAFLSSPGNASSRRTLVHACAGVSQSTKRAAASVDVPAATGDASGRSPPCFLYRVSFRGLSHI